MPKPEDGKEGTIEIVETTEAVPEAAPTEAVAREQGLSAKEIKTAKEHGLLAKEGDDANADDKASDTKAGAKDGTDNGAIDKSADKGGDSHGKEKEGEEERRKEGTVREIIDQDLDPEKEHEALQNFNANEKALYWRAKKDKTKRQSAEAERDHTAIKLKAQEKETEALRVELAALKNTKKESDEFGADDNNLDDKPLTEKDLDAREKRKQEEFQKQQEVRREHARKLNEKHLELEIEAKSRYTDFDEASNLASEIVQADAAGKLNEMFPDPRTSSRIHRKVQELLAGLVRADEYQDGEYNPADIAYEIGQSHPKYGKPSSTTNGNKSGKDQALSPEDVDKLARRRTPSAAISGGGGRRVVSYDDLTIEDAAKLSDKAFRALPKQTRERLARL